MEILKSMEIGRLSRFAETYFASLCAAADVRCHESQEDENGWDYIVEFPPDPSIGHADTHPPFKKAFVQIKSSRTNRLSCSIKLSNALKAAQSPDPWFMVLTLETRTGPEIYAIHIWKDLIEKILKAVRQASIDKKPLNREKFTIRFTPNDLRTNNLLAWMKAEIGGAPPNYELAKSNIFKSAGYSNGGGSAKVTFASTSKEQLINELLGCGGGLPVSRFTFTPSRFGLLDVEPLIDMKEGRIEIKPDATCSCELRLREPSSGNILSIPAQLFVLGQPWLPAEQMRVRLTTADLEIIWGSDGETKFDINFDEKSRVEIDRLHRFAQIISWLKFGPINAQIWVGDKRFAWGELKAKPINRGYDWQKILGVLTTLKSLPSTSGSTFRLSVNDLDRSATDLSLMHATVSSPRIRFELFETIDEANKPTTALYYTAAEVSDFAAFVLVERKILSIEAIEDGYHNIDFGPAIIHESWIIESTMSACGEMITNDYAKHLAGLEKETTVLSLGDINELIQRSMKGD